MENALTNFKAYSHKPLTVLAKKLEDGESYLVFKNGREIILPADIFEEEYSEASDWELTYDVKSKSLEQLQKEYGEDLKIQSETVSLIGEPAIIPLDMRQALGSVFKTKKERYYCNESYKHVCVHIDDHGWAWHHWMIEWTKMSL
jgi:hypothetical protein